MRSSAPLLLLAVPGLPVPAQNPWIGILWSESPFGMPPVREGSRPRCRLAAMLRLGQRVIS